jgi:hypothetical protein
MIFCSGDAFLPILVSIGDIKETFRDEKRRMKVEKTPKRTAHKTYKAKKPPEWSGGFILSAPKYA